MYQCPSCCVFSSFLFFIPALISCHLYIQVFFSTMAVVSIIYHLFYKHEYPGKQVIKYTDLVLAIIAGAYSIYLAFSGPQTILVIVYYLCISFFVYFYFFSGMVLNESPEAYWWHSGLHVLAVLATLCLLVARNLVC